MTKIEIYYFSGTGNSLVVAKSLAEKLGARLIPLLPLLKKEVIETDAEVIGLVFPIYDFKAPLMIQSFTKKIPNLDSRYVFAVATYGFMPMSAMVKLRKSIQQMGGKLSGGFVVSMPNNGIITETITPERHSKMRNDWNAKLKEINDYVAARREGKIETSNILTHFILSGLFIRAIPKLVGLEKEVVLRGWESFAFTSDGKCTGCGVCVLVCPMCNVTLEGGKPSWGKDCLGCFACLQWCPEESIQAGRITVNQSRYHNPDVKISEIISQKVLDG